MRHILVLAFLSSLFLPAIAQEKKPEKKSPDGKTWMTKRGELLWEENFEGGMWSKEWNKYKGDAKVVEGDKLKVAEIAADAHHPAMSRKLGGDNNVIVQFKFKFEGSTWMGFALDDKEHVARLIMNPDQFKVVKMAGTGGTTKGWDIDTKKTKLADNAWHSMVLEIYGDEMVATLDDKEMVLGKGEGMTPTRTRCELISGGQFAWWDEVRCWKAELDDKWPQKKAQLLTMLKKKSEPTSGK